MKIGATSKNIVAYLPHFSCCVHARLPVSFQNTSNIIIKSPAQTTINLQQAQGCQAFLAVHAVPGCLEDPIDQAGLVDLGCLGFLGCPALQVNLSLPSDQHFGRFESYL